MSTPKTRNVTGTLFNVKGEPTSGTVQFMSPHNVSNNASDDIMVVSARSVIAGPDGEFQIPIPSSNDPAWSPSSWTWQIKMKTEDHTLVWNAVVPYSSVLDDIALNELAPVPAANGTLYALVNHTHSGLVTEQELADAIDAIGGGGGAVNSVNGQTGIVVISAADVGLGNVSNLSPANLPVSSATQTALNAKAPLASPTFTGTVSGITAAMVGLGNVSNVTSANLPVSTATQAALDTKPTLVGGLIQTSNIPAIAITEYLGTSANQAAMLAKTGQLGDWTIRTDTGTTWLITGTDPTQLTNWTAIPLPNIPVQSVNGQTGVIVLGKADVGLGNLDNTSDAAKPVSTAQAAAIAAMVDPTELTTALASFKTSVVDVGDAGVSFTANAAYTESQKALQSTILPSDQGLAAWSYDPSASQGGTVLPTAGLVFSVRMRILGVTQINNILMHLTAGGSGLTAGQCFAAVFNDAGTTLLGTTADQSTNWATGGPKTIPLVGAPITVTPYTWVRVVFWFNGTTGPTITRGSNINSAAVNLGMTSGYRYATSNAGTTTSLTSLGTLTASQAAWLVGLN